MSVQFYDENYQCKQCESLFIPFNSEIVCPKCGLKPVSDISKYSNYIKTVAGIMGVHKSKYGKFTTPREYACKEVVLVHQILFSMFDFLEYSKPQNEIDFLSKSVDNVYLGGREYFNKNLLEIVLAVRERLIKGITYEVEHVDVINDKHTCVNTGLKLSFWQKIRWWFGLLIP
jgi:hypothetical protein